MPMATWGRLPALADRCIPIFHRGDYQTATPDIASRGDDATTFKARRFFRSRTADDRSQPQPV